MRARRRRFSGVTLLAATVLVLLPALAWLQYSWLDQIATADRERRERTLQTAASQLADDLDGELSRAFAGLQIDGATVTRAAWSGYGQRYSTWAASAANPAMLEAVYLIETPEALSVSGQHTATGPRFLPARLRRWTPATGTFEIMEWPDDLAMFRDRIQQQSAHFDVRSGRRGERLLPPLLALGDERTLIAPIMHIGTPGPGQGLESPRDLTLVGFTLIRLDLTVIRQDVLPALVRRHFFDAVGASEYRVAVIEREHPDRIVYESEDGAALSALQQPDASATFMTARMRPAFLMARGERHGNHPPESTAPSAPSSGDSFVINVIETRRGERGQNLQTRVLSSMEGHWRLVVKHRVGSLEAAVAGTRARNFALSSGILVLLTAAIGLLLVSARRADRLARQQLDFVAAVSHELRTPVSVIGAAAGNLADGVVGDPGRVKKYGATIQGEARRLAETVERVLQLAGIAAGRAAAPPVPVVPADLVADTLDACRTDLDAADMRVEVDVAANLPAVAGDAGALKSALQNLVSNAVKYAHEGRWMRVSAQLYRGPRLHLRPRPFVPVPSGSAGPKAGRGVRGSRPWGRPVIGRPFVDFVIEDRGPGISPADRKHIFEPFYRGRDAVARQIQGSGLGLNLVLRIAEAHNGTVLASSEPGRGARFTLRLPATEACVAEPALLHAARSTQPSALG